MAYEPDDTLELTAADELPEQNVEPEEISIEIEGDEPANEPNWVKALRDHARDLARENAELRKTGAPKPIEVGKEPSLEECEWDEDRFKRDWQAWNGRKLAAERQQSAQQEAEQARSRTYERAVESYRGQAAQLGVKGFADAEKLVMDALPEAVKTTVVQYFKEPAKLVAALGKSPARLAAIAAEPDQMRMVLALKDLEGSIKVVNKRRPPEPEAETIQRGSASVARVDTDKKLKKLEEEARRTGKRTELIAYKMELEAKEKRK